ncbi:unnamed protein product [Somion occarium]|uniref:AAA+ ATPase domain-containing protein n=1 Tax=Somion occarium TaxID=3059160 RepID=A0ABP1D1B5_9APHY
MTVYRDEDRLSKKPPEIVLQLEGQKDVTATMLKLAMARPDNISLYQIDTAIFAYEPILAALQATQKLSLSPELMLWAPGSTLELTPHLPNGVVDAIRMNPSQNLQRILGASKSIRLDHAQAQSLLQGLTQRLSLIQGPPGTGKSFIGAILAKLLHDHTSEKILVVCYTNHALDQFLEDLLDIGIPSSSVVRLGGKSTARTEPLSLFKMLQARNQGFKFSRSDWTQIDALKQESDMLSKNMSKAFDTLRKSNPQYDEYLQYLEFEDPEYYDAFQVPQLLDGMQRVGQKGKDVKADYLIHRWSTGKNAGMFQSSEHVRQTANIWNAPLEFRRDQLFKWKEALLKEYAEAFASVSRRYNACLLDIDRKYGLSSSALLQSKRIIGCTTTAAAKYREDVQAARPGILLVEEAGEILESHIITSLCPSTKQLILIGDHKQLRPKVNNYLLTVEKGEGYDLNRSLFERLVLKGYPHTTLSAQHRMRPEISSLVRQLTYPDLIDAPNTQNRPSLRGVRDNVVFVNHSTPEDDASELEERKDVTVKSSKRNTFEVEMVLKIVRYLAQQGYGTDRIVILTPYLGQLREIQKALQEHNDPILNDLDSYDLVRAGLVSDSAAKLTRKPIHLATVDNYQGEESDIVIVSLTRSNDTHDIGFMSSNERLTVLLSRARDALIMIGNTDTFMHARKGGEVWTRLFGILKNAGHLYDGFPVQCERHPDRRALLRNAADFDKECPDGGCSEPCTTMLSCNVHRCPSKCHQLSDHSKMSCEVVMFSNCTKGHSQQWKCHKGPPLTCCKCEREAKLAEKQRQADFARQEKLDVEQRLHDEKLAAIDAEIALHRDTLRGIQLAEERRAALEQRRKDLEDVANMARARSDPQVPPPVPSQSEQSEKPPKVTSSVPSSEVPTATSSSKSNHPAHPQSPAPPKPSPKSGSRDEWERQKTMEGAVNDAIDAIMEMSGLEQVKEQVLRIKAKVDTAQRQGTSLKGERFNVAMLGNPGTGKTTVARHYAKFLASVQVLPGNMFIETTGSRLANDGVPAVKKHLEDIINAGGGAIFVDEAYQLTSQHNFQGGQVLDCLLAEMENQVGKVVFIFAGYNREMEKFFEHNPGLTSRVPYKLQFTDYEDPELLDMLENLIHKTWNGRMKVEDTDGIRGLFGRITVRRLGRGRGREGFGNARALQNLFAKIRERQSERLTRQRRDGLKPDDLLLVKEDLIGPDPAQVMVESPAWKKLQGLIGLKAVKQSVANLFDMVKRNYERELLEKAPHQVSLNRVFIGSPGTGKTTVAKLYGQILTELGLISNGEVVIKNPADFIGSALGQSESQTKAILANTVGKVLIIDEAYMLYGGSGEGKGSQDPYKTAVIDTIVAEVQSVPGEDRCVLLLGYKQQIEEMFQNVNPGLARRFAIENAFQFDDYSDSELLQALEWKLKDGDLSATESAKRVAIEVLSRLRNRPNFGNIGEVENILGQAKVRYQQRQATLPVSERRADAPFEPQDFDPQYDRHEHATANLAELFEDTVGCDEIISKLAQYQQMAKRLKKQGKDPRDIIPTNFVFKGPPGTGKTTTARKMGKVYYDMGFLSSTEVVECSASDLVGQYVGHTGPKTKKLFEKALGRVLFVDEAYRLSEGHFAKEAMDELVGILTQEAFRGKLVVILAGYDQEMNELLAVNTGLSSRFPNEVIFRNMSPQHCLQILKKELQKHDIQIDALENPSDADYARMASIISSLSTLPSWGNARDVMTLAKKLVTVALTSTMSQNDADDASATISVLPADDVVACMQEMLTDRRERCSNVPKPKQVFNPQMQLDAPWHSAPPPTTQRIETVRHTPAQPGSQQVPTLAPVEASKRDPGVSDQVWHQLQADKKAAEELEKQLEEEVIRKEQQVRDAAKREEEAHVLAERLAKAQAKDAEGRAELMRQREQARLREIAIREERARIQAALEQQRREEEQRRKEEVRVQTKIREMGVCPVGYRWIKQSSGYCCAGGSHFLSNEQLGI